MLLAGGLLSGFSSYETAVWANSPNLGIAVFCGLTAIIVVISSVGLALREAILSKK
jgi:hypothetical protein